MGKKKSDYTKLLDSLGSYSGIEEVETLEQWLEAREKAIEYIMGIPFEHMTPEGYSKIDSLLDQWLYEKKEQIKDLFIARLTEFMRFRKRYKPSYIKVLEFLIDHPEWIDKYHEAKLRTYREIAEILGYKYSTVRDAFSYIRQAGLLEE